MSDSDSENEDNSVTSNKTSKISSGEFQERLRHLQSMFPTQTKESLEEVVKMTKSVDEAIDIAIDMAQMSMLNLPFFVILSGCPLSWKTAISQGKIFLKEKSGKFMKNCQSWGETKLF